MSWNNLSMKDKASYIRMGVENGITDLDIVREVYNKFADGGPIKKSYKDFSTRLSKAWNNEDLSRHDYDYQKYYNDDPEEAYRQLESIEHGSKGHFPDGGKSGTYKTPNHPTYPDLGANSWFNNDRIFNISARQAVPENTDRVLDYLGSDLNYNRGATRVMYDGAYQLPEVTVTPNGNYTELIPNELGTGWMYIDRAGRFDDIDYSYLDNYLGNKKSLGGNLYGNGGNKPRYKSSSNIRKKEKKIRENSRYQYMPYTGSIIGPIPTLPITPEARKEDAAFISICGNIIGNFIPVIGNSISLASSIPDAAYDISNMIESPSWKSAGHILLDGINRATRWTTTKGDDIIGGLGIIDDAIQSQGKDIFDWIDEKFSNKRKKK